MALYDNKEYLKKEIMMQSRHQFIYGYNNESRLKLLSELDKEYPIVFDESMPMSICIDDFGLPKISELSPLADKDKISILCREYLAATIAHAILLKSQNCFDVEVLDLRLKRLLHFINRFSLNAGYDEIKSVEELTKALRESKDFYLAYYLEYLKTGTSNLLISDLKVPFLHLETFVTQYKRALSNDSYFGIILDKQKDFSIESIRATNFYIGARINKDISMKVVVEPDKWESYIDPNGQYIEGVHDYGEVELDDSLEEYIRRLKK